MGDLLYKSYAATRGQRAQKNNSQDYLIYNNFLLLFIPHFMVQICRLFLQNHDFNLQNHNFDLQNHNFDLQNHNFELQNHNFELQNHNFDTQNHNFDTQNHNFDFLSAIF